MEQETRPFPVFLAAIEAYELQTGFTGLGKFLERGGYIHIIEAEHESNKNRQSPLINSDSWRSRNEGGVTLSV